ncbi:hypothetical protein HB780_00185 (plasmid) [Rhizobium lusitanum]|uniref:hypothetical protein n=1 Tax=Rhizobium lusitanum TaxID=293958 RepID=UPI0016111B08|nr:hypothetical protein [Rhizobium lusitanum]QND44287.1 hypothetical protein HB780_00185 [Rhizobium lusitanum]
MKNAAQELVKEYQRLGGRREVVIDDNELSTRTWEPDTPEADAFWREKIEKLSPERRNEVESFLPSINAK